MNTVNTDMMQRHEMDFTGPCPIIIIISAGFSAGSAGERLEGKAASL